jgi:predicted nuclease with TOPRIM domain
LKRKVAALTEAEKGQAELRKALEAKDAELAKVRADLDAERRSHTNAEQLRRELREPQADVKLLKRQVGILRGDVEEPRWNEQRMSDAFEMLNAKQQKSKETWKRIQTRLVADVESTIHRYAPKLPPEKTGPRLGCLFRAVSRSVPVVVAFPTPGPGCPRAVS